MHRRLVGLLRFSLLLPLSRVHARRVRLSQAGDMDPLRATFLTSPPARWYGNFSSHDWSLFAASSAILLTFFVVVRGVVEYGTGPPPNGQSAAEAEAARKVTRKSRAWTMSLLNSAVLSTIGVYYAWMLLTAPPASFSSLALSEVTDGPLPSRAGLMWMMAFMTNDMLVGVFFYGEQ